MTTKNTRGQEKMKRYILDLVRNDIFLKSIEELKSYHENKKVIKGRDAWIEEKQSIHRGMYEKLEELVVLYEKLRVKSKKITRKPYFKIEQDIAIQYGLDNELLCYLMACRDNFRNIQSVYREYVDMCRVENTLENELAPSRPGDEVIHFNPLKRLNRIAYPVSINIHARATKRDVLDFVEKKWEEIEFSLRHLDEKPLRARTRKHDQKMVDYIWGLRKFSTTQIKQKIDKLFPGNNLVYYEINKIIYLERDRRETNNVGH